MYYYIKFFVSTALFCLLCSFSNRNTLPLQQPTSVAYYQFFHIKDTTQLGRVWTEDFILTFNTNRSFYTSQTRAKKDSTLQIKFKEAEYDNNVVIDMGLLRPTTEEDLFTDEHSLYAIENYRENRYLIKENLEKTSWTIGKETKQLLGYTCQIATGIVKGRKYIVWFTTDIPAAFGPWKLRGLPGLILEAYDEHQYIKFICTRVETNGAISDMKSLDLPANSIPTTRAQYVRMKKALSENSGVENSRSDITIEKVTVNGGEGKTSTKKQVINYPLELTK